MTQCTLHWVTWSDMTWHLVLTRIIAVDPDSCTKLDAVGPEATEMFFRFRPSIVSSFFTIECRSSGRLSCKSGELVSWTVSQQVSHTYHSRWTYTLTFTSGKSKLVFLDLYFCAEYETLHNWCKNCLHLFDRLSQWISFITILVAILPDMSHVTSSYYI
mgnify:CR=1 FL=1